MANSFESEVVTIRRRGAFLLASLAGSTFQCLSLITGLGRYPLISILGSLVALAGIGCLFLFLRNVLPVRRTARLRAGADGIALDGKLSIPKASIVTGYALASGEPTVRIAQRIWRGLPVDIRVRSNEEARALLDALGLGVSSAKARFDAIHGGMRRQMITAVAVGVLLPLGLFLGIFGAMIMHAPLTTMIPAIVMLTVVALGFGMRSQSKVIVGTDGLLVSRWGFKDFIPYAEIKSIGCEGGDVVVVRDRAPPLRLGFGARQVMGQEHGLTRDAFVLRVEEARAACVTDDEGTRVAALVARGNRSTREWLDAIRAMVKDPSYREAALLPEHLWRLIEDPSREPSARAGAAVALAPSLGQEGRARLRVAAELCASPRLRVTFEAAARGDDLEPLEEVIESLATQTAQSAKGS